MSTRLIWITPDAERLMGYCARVSNPENQENPNVSQLLRFCIKNGHWSVFEMADMCIEMQTTRGISAQITRHRSFHFQEFCITGDSLITTILPASGLPSYMPIKKLFERQKWKNYRDIQLRVYNEKTKSFTRAGFREVFATGAKPVYEITLADGKKIRCTKEHKFLTQSGFMPLEEIVGLEMIGERATMTRDGIVGTNGVPCYQDREWLAEQRATLPRLPLAQIAENNTLRARWTKILKIEYVGLEDTYDIEVDHESHNYVANRIVVHNSQRYAAVQRIEEVSPRRQDMKNRQSSHNDLPAETLEWFSKAQEEHFTHARKIYDEALEKGIAKESARFLLPMASGTTIYMKGTVRDWVHYIALRSDPGTQLEHRELALGCKTIFVEQLPVVAEALGWHEAASENGSMPAGKE
ncbi:MAG: hypothetical protein NVSMB31_00030 [Vulcanimicrobiaceae bacterium]